MANIRDAMETAEIHRKVLTAATRLFIEKGYERTTVLDIAKLSGIPKTKIFYEMKSKEDILSTLVTKFLDGVTAASNTVSQQYTDDKIFIYVANEVLQIYMSEMNEDMRNLYLSGYSLHKTSESVLLRRTDIMIDIFGKMFPDFEKKDFYEIEIASMGIMRAYMTVPCDMYFTLESKAKRLVTMLLRIYKTEDKKISEALEFIEKIDFEAIAEKAVADVFNELAIQKKNSNIQKEADK